MAKHERTPSISYHRARMKRTMLSRAPPVWRFNCWSKTPSRTPNACDATAAWLPNAPSLSVVRHASTSVLHALGQAHLAAGWGGESQRAERHWETHDSSCSEHIKGYRTEGSGLKKWMGPFCFLCHKCRGMHVYRNLFYPRWRFSRYPLHGPSDLFT